MKRAKKEAKKSRKTGRKKGREGFGSPGPSNQETDASTSDDNRGDQGDDDENSSDDNAATQNANNRNRLEESCWTKVPDTEDKTREEEFDDYLADLLL